MEKEIKDFIHDEMVAFGVEFQTRRKAYLQAKISASGALAASLDFEVDRQARTEAVQMVIAFEEHGRYIDMKRLKAVIPSNSDNEYVTMIENWIRERGWEDKFVIGFMRRHKIQALEVTPKVLHRIAWGIVIARATRVRPRKWYNRAKTASIVDLFNKVVAGLPEKTTDIIVDSFK